MVGIPSKRLHIAHLCRSDWDSDLLRVQSRFAQRHSELLTMEPKHASGHSDLLQVPSKLAQCHSGLLAMQPKLTQSHPDLLRSRFQTIPGFHFSKSPSLVRKNPKSGHFHHINGDL
jgi:hypothetical protein